MEVGRSQGLCAGLVLRGRRRCEVLWQGLALFQVRLRTLLVNPLKHVAQAALVRQDIELTVEVTGQVFVVQVRRDVDAPQADAVIGSSRAGQTAQTVLFRVGGQHAVDSVDVAVRRSGELLEVSAIG